MWGKPAVNAELRSKNSGYAGVAAAQQHNFAAFIPASVDSAALEQALKKSIPVLIIAFLICIGLARGFALLSSHGRMENAIRQATELSAAVAVASMQDDIPAFSAQSGDPASDRLTREISASGIASDTDLIFINTSGAVFAATDGASELVGRSLSSVFPQLASAHREAGVDGVFNTTIDDEPYQVAPRLIGSNGGMIAAIHSLGAMNARWRAEVNLNVTLFAATAVLLLVVLYAYYAQLGRADKTRDTLKRERGALEATLANGDAGLWTFDPASRQILLDRSAQTAIGAGNIASLSYRALISMIHPDDRKGLSRLLCPAESGLIQAGFRIIQRDGSYAHFELRAHASRLNDQLAISGVAIRSCESHRRAHAESRRARQLQAALDAVPHSVALWCKDGRMLATNRSFADESLLKDCRDNLAAARPDHSHGNIVRRVIGDDNGSMEILTSDGRWVNLVQTQTAEGDMIAVGTDITGYKEEQARLVAEQERLREKINGLAAARRRLEHQSVALNLTLEKHQNTSAPITGLPKANACELVSGEIRTALTTVSGFSQLMAMELEKLPVDVGNAERYARHVIEGAESLLDMFAGTSAMPSDHPAYSTKADHTGVIVRRTAV